MSRWSGGLAALAGILLLAHSAGAAVMMIDFGAVSATGNDRLSSPYHTDYNNFTDTSWNKVNADVASGGLLWSDGSVASGVSINLGRTTSAGATSLDLSQAVLNGSLGAQVNTGIYSGTNPGRDGIYGNGSSASRYVGLQLGGLAAGLYEIYITGRNTSLAGASTMNFFIGTSASAGNFSFAGMHTEALSYVNVSTPSTAAWVEDVNYVRYTINLAAGQYVNIATLGGGGDLRGFLNSFQIGQVVIPEPSSILLMLVGFLGVNRYRRGLRQRAIAAGLPDSHHT